MDILIKDKMYKGFDDEVARKLIWACNELCTPPCIYAVEKDGLIELRNHTYKNKLVYRSSFSSFVKQGFKVYGRET